MANRRDYQFETYQRDDGKWAWRLMAPNGRVIATDAGQGFRDRTDAERSISLVRIAAGWKGQRADREALA